MACIEGFAAGHAGEIELGKRDRLLQPSRLLQGAIASPYLVYRLLRLFHLPYQLTWIFYLETARIRQLGTPPSGDIRGSEPLPAPHLYVVIQRRQLRNTHCFFVLR